MKNIQIIDGANNCAYSICKASDETFSLIFPFLGQDIEFVEDFVKRVGEKKAGEILEAVCLRSLHPFTLRALCYALERALLVLALVGLLALRFALLFAHSPGVGFWGVVFDLPVGHGGQLFASCFQNLGQKNIERNFPNGTLGIR